jgi:signal peptidase I
MKEKKKQLKRLNRTQLLELLSKQSEEIDSLKEKIGKDKEEVADLPDTESINNELGRVKFKRKYAKTLRSTISILITVAAIAILIATLWLPVLQIYGNSMTPNLNNGEIVVTVKTSDFKQGDIIAFYYNNKILVKRVIAKAGDWVDIKSDGTVYVNEKELDEPYVKEKALGECDITFPYQVPEERVFVMGDHRSVSVDSRSSSIGCVAEEEIVGKLALKIWPLKDITTF